MAEETLKMVTPAASAPMGERPAAGATTSRITGTVAVTREGRLSIQPAWEAGRMEWVPRVVLLAATQLILGSLTTVLFPDLLFPHPSPPEGGTRHQLIDNHFAVQVIIACLLPPMLAWFSYLLINKRAVCQYIRPRVSADLEGPAVAELAASSWAFELGRAHWFLSRAEVFAGLWGMITTVTIVGAVTFLLPWNDVAADHQSRRMVALAVIGAAATSFLLELARVCIRTANDDATKRMFAEAMRTLILAVVSTLALILLLRVIGPDMMRRAIFEATDVEAHLVALGLGAGVAVLGPPAFDWIQGRVASTLGIDRKKRDVGTSLDALDDVGEAEITRLSEEGIESVEALVSTSIPRLFLNTRFSLQRVAHWQDLGLLISRIGAAAASDLRHRWGICGASEVRRIKNEGSAQSVQTLREIFKKNMRVDGDAEAELVVQQIADDERVALINVFRHTVIEKNDPAAF
ncbi:MAG TPA: hypothetical protein VFH68_18315 [Polyangia bacterium]|nr:hypothetical protein [Polyangia bacterium]